MIRLLARTEGIARAIFVSDELKKSPTRFFAPETGYISYKITIY